MAYWLTEQDPFVLAGKKHSGVWVRPGKERAANKLKIGDLVFIYEVFKSRDTGVTGGAKSVLLLVEVAKRVNKNEGKWIRVAEAKPVAEGKCPHQELLRIIGYERIQSLGPMNSKLLEINYEQFENIAHYFPNYKSGEQLAEEEVVKTFTDLHSPRGQGFASKEIRDAIECYSMDKALGYFKANGYSTENHSKFRPYDLYCKKNGKEYFVEVKGTQGTGNELFLTSNEVRWANAHYKNMILFIVHSIEVQSTSTELKVADGIIMTIDQWKPEKDNLFPIAYRYIFSSF